MKLSKDDCRELLRKGIDQRCDVIEESCRRVDGGWYWMYQSKEWLRTRAFEDMLVGQGGAIVDEQTGFILQLGSGRPLEQQLSAWNWGLRANAYDLVIEQVLDERATVRLLEKLRLSYVVPETDPGGTVWRIANRYSTSSLLRRLGSLPCVFARQRLWCDDLPTLEEMTSAGCCKWSLRLITRALKPTECGDELPAHP
jgi:hypothetical protein